MDRVEDEMSRWKSRGIRRLICAIGFSLDGLRFAFHSEAAFRQELAALLVLVPLALWLRDAAVDRALLIGSLFLVLVTELLNTAIEAVVDRVPRTALGWKSKFNSTNSTGSSVNGLQSCRPSKKRKIDLRWSLLANSNIKIAPGPKTLRI